MNIQQLLENATEKSRTVGVRLSAIGFRHVGFLGEAALGWVVGVRSVHLFLTENNQRTIFCTARNHRFPFYLASEAWKGSIEIDILRSAPRSDGYQIEISHNGVGIAPRCALEVEPMIKDVFLPF